MILGIKFSALQQGRQGHSKPALLSWRARPWFRTEPAVLSCNSSSYDWRWSQLRQQLWAWHRAENLRTKRFESLAKMTLMHRDAPVWHRKTFCVALHSLKITGGFVASSQDAATGTIWSGGSDFQLGESLELAGGKEREEHCIMLHQLLSGGRD